MALMVLVRTRAETLAPPQVLVGAAGVGVLVDVVVEVVVGAVVAVVAVVAVAVDDGWAPRPCCERSSLKACCRCLLLSNHSSISLPIPQSAHYLPLSRLGTAVQPRQLSPR